jgi:hypothetical protein
LSCRSARRAWLGQQRRSRPTTSYATPAPGTNRTLCAYPSDSTRAGVLRGSGPQLRRTFLMFSTKPRFCRALRLSVAYSAGLFGRVCIKRRCDKVSRIARFLMYAVLRPYIRKPRCLSSALRAPYATMGGAVAAVRARECPPYRTGAMHPPGPPRQSRGLLASLVALLAVGAYVR